jgi:7,8-dihydroneopterin aldolase/epimerase/oxygenase
MTVSSDPLRIADVEAGIRHVFIRNLELDIEIGIYSHEHGKTQKVRLNVDMAVDDTPVTEDRLESVVDYADITRKVRKLVAGGHVALAETLAEKVAEICFEDARVRMVRVRVEKLEALKNAESAGIEIERRRR